MKKEINKPDGAKTKQITLVVNGNLHRDLKLLSIQSNQTLQSIVERMLRNELYQPERINEPSI